MYYLRFLFLCVCTFAAHSQSYTVCDSSGTTLVATNSSSLTNPSYSLQPGGITNTTGSFAVTPNVTTIYTLYVTGTNTNSAVMTTSTTATVNVVQPPVFNVMTAAGFTLGCGMRAAITVTVLPISPTTAITYTWLSPGSPTVPGGALSNVTVYTITAAGNHTAVVREGVCGHETRVPVTVISNTSGPQFDSLHVSSAISCHDTLVMLKVFTDGDSLRWLPKYQGMALTSSVTSVYIPGSYSVFARNPATGCSGFTTVNVQDHRGVPNIFVEAIHQLCNTPSIVITATPSSPVQDTTIQWMNIAGQIIATGPSATINATGMYFLKITSQYGCSITKKIIVNGCAGIEEHSDKGFHCWPVPFTDRLTFRFADQTLTEVRMYNTAGALVKQAIISTADTLNVSDLPAGVYYVVCGGAGVRVVKM